jgi:hypothetical protein
MERRIMSLNRCCVRGKLCCPGRVRWKREEARVTTRGEKRRPCGGRSVAGSRRSASRRCVTRGRSCRATRVQGKQAMSTTSMAWVKRRRSGSRSARPGRVMHPPAHESMGQQESVAFVSHQTRFFPTQRLATPSQMGGARIDARVDLPSLLRTADAFTGRGELRIEHDGHHAMQVVWIGVGARLRRRERSQALGGVWLETRRDHTHSAPSGHPTGCTVTRERPSERTRSACVEWVTFRRARAWACR